MAARYIGIDPGAGGGIVCLHREGLVELAVRMPETERDVLDVLRAHSALARAVIERVHSSPQMGVVSAFSFGRNVGMLKMGLIAADVAFDEVTSGVWQKAMGIQNKTGKTVLGETHKKDKNVAKARAQQLFPSVKVTHSIADALLIAEYARRLEMRA